MTSGIPRLLEIAPTPEEPRSKNWGEIERILDSDLPVDYKELIRIYGGSKWDNYLYVLEPECPNKHYDLITWARNQAEDLEYLWEVEKKPAELEDEGTRVLPWATTDNGECLYWLVRPGVDPDGWTVMVNEARGERWEHFPVSCTQFLASCLDGEVRSGILSTLFPLATHEFRHLRAV